MIGPFDEEFLAHIGRRDPHLVLQTFYAHEAQAAAEIAANRMEGIA